MTFLCILGVLLSLNHSFFPDLLPSLFYVLFLLKGSNVFILYGQYFFPISGVMYADIFNRMRLR